MATIKLRRGTSDQWTTKNPILAEGEPGFEIDSGNFKLGDGVTRWGDLPYYLPLNSTTPGDDSAAMAALRSHIASATPHPVYDDGPSLLLLYQNAKV